ncbi:quinon protein alcohol dehydrogenase-like superfamily [Aspergillus karnatakaensis]|uniref:WD40 repeat domain-containing protein n=1 Tax=Aspergillus karnatakaensis TaxID=1810916 RepID=UPI003CCE35EC
MSEPHTTSISEVHHTYKKDKNFLPILAAYFAPNGKLLATIRSGPGRLELYQVSDGAACSFYHGTLSLVPTGTAYDLPLTIGACQQRYSSANATNIGPLHGYWFMEERNKRQAVSADGNFIALAPENENLMHLLDTGTNKRRVLRGHRGSVSAIAFSHNSRLLASASSVKEIFLWPESMKAPYLVSKDHILAATSLMFSPDGTLVASVCGSSIFLWDTRTGRRRGTLDDPNFIATEARFTPDSKGIISWSNGTIQLWDVVSGSSPITLWGDEQKPSVKNVAFSTDGQLVVSISYSDLTIWDAVTGNARTTIECSHFRLSGMTFSPVFNKIVLASPDGTFRLVDLTKYTVHTSLKGPWYLRPRVKWLTSISGSIVQLRDIKTNELCYKLPHNKPVTCEASSSDGTLMATACKDGIIRVWYIETGIVHYKRVISSSISALAFASNNQFLAWASEGVVHIWNVTGLKQHTEFKIAKFWSEQIRNLAVSPDNKLLAIVATTHVKHVIRIWDLSKNRFRTTLSDATKSVSAVVFSPNCRIIAAIGDNGWLMFWKLDGNGKKPSQIVKDGSFWANGVVYSANGRPLAFSSLDGTPISGNKVIHSKGQLIRASELIACLSV